MSVNNGKQTKLRPLPRTRSRNGAPPRTIMEQHQAACDAETRRHEQAIRDLGVAYDRRIEIARTLRVDWRSGVVLTMIESPGLYTNGNGGIYSRTKEWVIRHNHISDLLMQLEQDGVIANFKEKHECRLILTPYGREIVAAMCEERSVTP